MCALYLLSISGVEPSGLDSGDGNLCKLVFKWLERVAEDRSIESLAENVGKVSVCS
jgi:hypothetical protein